MPYILCIETSSTNCSIAIASHRGALDNSFQIEHCLDLKEDNSDTYSHAESLHVFIKDLLDQNKITFDQLDAIAVSKGPGSYTGLRIGVATAKGLCYAVDKPLISIDTLQALSLQATTSDIIIPMMDARRMEVYSAVYRGKHLVQSTEAKILTQESYVEYTHDKNTTFIGSGALKFKELLNDNQSNYMEAHPTALTMCDLAIAMYNENQFVTDLAYYEPFYLKEFKSS